MIKPSLTGLPAVLAAALAFSPIAARANGEIIGIVESKSGRVADAVVNLVEVPGSFAPSKTAEMDQVNKEFNPHVLAVLKGTTVKFISSDPFFHNVFANSRVKTFNVSQEKKGDTSEITFDKIGIVPIHCHIHASMKAYIVVFANPFFQVTNAQGQFRISNVPPGTYQIKVWTETTPSQTQTVTVPASGQAKVIFKL